MPGIDFVTDEPSDADGRADEDLPGATPPPRRPARIALVVAAAAVLIGGGVVLRLHERSAPDAAGPTSTVSPLAADPILEPDVPSGAFHVDHVGVGNATASPNDDAPIGSHAGRSVGADAADLDCPSSSYCTRNFDVPLDVRRALTFALPDTTGLAVTSVLIQGASPTVALWHREVTARAGDLRLHVEMHLATDHDDPRTGSAPRGGGRVVFATALARGLAVVVLVTGPAKDVPSRAVVARLAADRRLLALP